MAQWVKKSATMQETWDPRDSPGSGEDPMEEDIATYSLAGKIPWTEEAAGYNPKGCKESDITAHTYRTGRC